MSKHEVVYFDGAGRAEAIRICLHVAKGVDGWKDTRIEGKDWPTLKPTTPLGSLPILKVDGTDHCQSIALARYAAKLAGWYPADDPLQGLIVDEVMDTANELMSLAPKSKDETELLKLRNEFQTTTMTKYANFIEKRIQGNGDGKCVSTSCGPTVADVVVMILVQSIQSGNWTGIDKDFFNDKSYPGIMATVQTIQTNEQVVAYYNSKK